MQTQRTDQLIRLIWSHSTLNGHRVGATISSIWIQLSSNIHYVPNNQQLRGFAFKSHRSAVMNIQSNSFAIQNMSNSDQRLLNKNFVWNSVSWHKSWSNKLISSSNVRQTKLASGPATSLELQSVHLKPSRLRPDATHPEADSFSRPAITNSNPAIADRC